MSITLLAFKGQHAIFEMQGQSASREIVPAVNNGRPTISLSHVLQYSYERPAMIRVAASRMRRNASFVPSFVSPNPMSFGVSTCRQQVVGDRHNFIIYSRGV